MERIFSLSLRSCLNKTDVDWKQIQEVRMRCDQPLIVKFGREEKVLDQKKGFISKSSMPYLVSMQEIQESLAYICQYSLYAYEDEIRQGYITIRGGHRVGISGQVVMENEEIRSLSYVTSLNLRVAHNIKGCGEHIFSYLWNQNRPCNTVIISPPGCGKTTLLRDLVRLFSNGLGHFPGQSVSLIDERSEVAACFQGAPQNDVGMRTDVMDHCPKALGVKMVVRSMGPKIVAFDELGSNADMEAVRYAAHSGCTVLTTMHGSEWFDPTGIFERYILLNDWNSPRRIRKILNREGDVICGG